MVFLVHPHSCAYMSGSIGYRIESYYMSYKNIAIIIVLMILRKTIVFTITISITITTTKTIAVRIMISLIPYGGIREIMFFRSKDEEYFNV